MTVTRENLDHLWSAVEFGLGYDTVRRISFQPMLFSGRIPQDRAAVEALANDRLHTSDIILNAVAQSGGNLRFEDFTPLPCGDPNCATIGYLLKVGGAIRSVSGFIDFTKVQDFLRLTPKPMAGFSRYQIAALGLVALGVWGFLRLRKGTGIHAMTARPE